jgi:hypothetical protein
MGWVNKVTLAPCPFLIYHASPSDFQLFLIHPPELSGNYKQRHLVAKQEKLGEKRLLNFAYDVSLLYTYDSLTGCKLTTRDQRLYFSSDGSHATYFYCPLKSIFFGQV